MNTLGGEDGVDELEARSFSVIRNAGDVSLAEGYELDDNGFPQIGKIFRVYDSRVQVGADFTNLQEALLQFNSIQRKG